MEKQEYEKGDLFETLAVMVGCDYVSDLRFEPYNSRAKKYLKGSFGFDLYSVGELEDLYCYVYSRTAKFGSKEEVKSAFMLG